jgi:alpha-ketoglutarate-dependent taurine dioxygenase
MGLHTIQADSTGLSLSDFVCAKVREIPSLLLEHGAILFRGFIVAGTADYQSFIEALGVAPVDYTYRSTPRTDLGRAVYTATEYPPRHEIPMHCENAYQRVWPMWLSLCCLTPATRGGQTPIANMRDVTAAIGPRIVEQFAVRKVRYIRHYHPHVDLSWPDVFRTSDREALAQFCRKNDMHHEWLDGNVLRTEQICQGVAKHPETHSVIFFNQAHLFHVSSLDPLSATDMIRCFGADRLPRNASYGDGAEIAPKDLEQIRYAFKSASIDLGWQRGDVLLLDNMQYAHGSRSYSGERRVLASLLKPSVEKQAPGSQI